MKKIVIILFSLILLTGCGLTEITLENWPKVYPVYEGKGKIFYKSNKNLIEVRNVNKADAEKYIEKIKNEYSSAIVDYENNYQGVNENQSMIKVEYVEKEKVLKISEN